MACLEAILRSKLWQIWGRVGLAEKTCPRFGRGAGQKPRLR
jgi:hypothetical protein